jgi:hypothetical protein
MLNQTPRAHRTPICRPIQGRSHYQELLLFAGRYLVEVDRIARGRIVSLKMEGVLFKGILAWVIHCYQYFKVFFAHFEPLTTAVALHTRRCPGFVLPE